MLRKLYRSIWGTFKHKHKWGRAQYFIDSFDGERRARKYCTRCGNVAQVKTRKPAAKPLTN